MHVLPVEAIPVERASSRTCKLGTWTGRQTSIEDEAGDVVVKLEQDIPAIRERGMLIQGRMEQIRNRLRHFDGYELPAVADPARLRHCKSFGCGRALPKKQNMSEAYWL